jgi:hypothetical protein
MVVLHFKRLLQRRLGLFRYPQEEQQAIEFVKYEHGKKNIDRTELWLHTYIISTCAPAHSDIRGVMEHDIESGGNDAGAGGKRQTPPLVRLTSLMHKAYTEQGNVVPIRNLFNFVSKEYPEFTVGIMKRLAGWDNSGGASFLLAKFALKKGELKVAEAEIAKLLSEQDVSDEILLLGARVFFRLNKSYEAGALLDRIQPGSKFQKGVEELRARRGKRELEDSLESSGASVRE